MDKKTRKSYSNATKIKILEHAEQYGNREAARVFGCDEKSVKEWRRSRDGLKLSEPLKRTSKPRGRKAFCLILNKI